MTHLRFGDIEVLLESVCGAGGNRPARERATAAAMAREIFGPDAIIEHTPSGRPYIPDSPVRISVSHSARTVALAWSRAGSEIGVDIEGERAQLRRVAPRVLSEREMECYGGSDALLAAAWTLKEAAYKAAGIAGADFRADIVLPAVPDAGALVQVRGTGLRIVFCGMAGNEHLAVVEKFF